MTLFIIAHNIVILLYTNYTIHTLHMYTWHKPLGEITFIYFLRSTEYAIIIILRIDFNRSVGVKPNYF